MIPPSVSRQREPNLWDYIAILHKRRWTITLFVFILVVIVGFASLKVTPIYEASVQILIERESPNVVSFDEVVKLDASHTDYYQTQYRILQSRGLARKVIEKLNLASSPEFSDSRDKDGFSLSTLRDRAQEWLSRAFPSTSVSQPGAIDPETRLVDEFLDRLQVEPIRNSRLVNVSFRGYEPKLIADIANAVANVYIEQDFENKFQASQQAVEWLNQRIAELRKKVEDSERAVQEYKETYNLVSLEERQNIVVQKLAELNSELTRARTETIAHETLYNELVNSLDKPEVLESIPSVINNPLIQNLKEEYGKLTAEYSDMSKRYKPKHPRIIRLQSQIDEMRQRISEEVRKIIKSIETEYKVALAREQSLDKSLTEQKKEALELNRRAIQYGALQRETESNRQLYEILLNRVKETSLTTELRSSNIRVLDPAEVPIHPVLPRKKLNVALAALVGLILGSAIAFFQEYLDNTIKTPDDIENYLGVHFLGYVGSFKKGDGVGASSELITLANPKSNVAEGFKQIRTNMIFAAADPSNNAFLFTSALPSEGKTLVCANLAVAMSQMGKNVLLIDGDLRRPRLHELFFLDNSEGLTNVLIGSREPEEVVADTHIAGLKMVTCGPVPPNPSELLASERARMFIRYAKLSYDVVLVDSPPVLTVTDPVIMASILDGAVLVTKAGDTPIEPLMRSVKQLREANATILGVVLNSVNPRRDSYYYYRYYHYYDYEKA